MKEDDIIKLLPKDKFDDSTINELMKLNENEINIILPELFDWLADFNWPIAKDILKLIIRFPNSLIPLIKNALRASEKDDILKYWIIIELLPELPLKAQCKLLPDIERILNSPTEMEIYEEILEVALIYKNTFEKKYNI